MVNLHNRGALEAMEQAPFEFHLTGSRFFETASQDSDWDFFVESDPDLPAWLEANGFELESDSDYVSTGISEVWINEPWRVHIQIISDARLKADVQEAMRDSGYAGRMYRMSKDDRKALWNFAFTLFEAGKAKRSSYCPRW